MHSARVILGCLLIFCFTFSLFNWTVKGSDGSFLKKIEIAKKLASNSDCDADADDDCEDDSPEYCQSEVISNISANTSKSVHSHLPHLDASCGYWNITTPPPKM